MRLFISAVIGVGLSGIEGNKVQFPWKLNLVQNQNMLTSVAYY